MSFRAAESAAGAYPISAVRMMARIAEQTERDPLYRAIMNAEKPKPESTSADAISASAAQTAETLRAAAIVGYTDSGSTALRAARERLAQDSPRSEELHLLASYDRLAQPVHPPHDAFFRAGGHRRVGPGTLRWAYRGRLGPSRWLRCRVYGHPAQRPRHLVGDEPGTADVRHLEDVDRHLRRRDHARAPIRLRIA